MSYRRLDDRYQSRDGDHEYLHSAKMISGAITSINNNARNLDKLSKHIGTPRENRNTFSQIRRLTQDTQELIERTKSDIDGLGHVDGGGQQEMRNRRQEMRKYTRDLQTATRKFEAVMSRVLELEEASVQRERAESVRAGGGGGGGGGMDSYGSSYEQQQQQQQQDMAMAQDVSVRTEFIQEREQGIKELHQDMEKVHSMFQDVSTMVQDQGEALESIESNMQVTYDRVDRGVGELTHASRYQKSARNKAMCLLVIVVIVAGVLAAILVPTLKKK